MRRIYRVVGLPTLRGRTQTHPPLCVPSAGYNRLSSVSLQNCPPYFYHITSFLSHLPLTAAISSFPRFLASPLHLDALVDPLSHLHLTRPSPLSFSSLSLPRLVKVRDRLRYRDFTWCRVFLSVWPFFSSSLLRLLLLLSSFRSTTATTRMQYAFCSNIWSEFKIMIVPRPRTCGPRQ